MSQSVIGQRFESIINILIQQKKVESYSDFAQKMGFKSKSSISSIIAGRANPTPELLNAMAKHFKVSANYILLGNGDMFLLPASEPQTPTITEKQQPWTPQTIYADDAAAIKKQIADNIAALRGGETVDDIMQRYHRAFHDNSMSAEQRSAYRAVVNISLVDTVVDLMYRMDQVNPHK